MPSASQRPLHERLLMACMALLFLLQPLALAAGSCRLRAQLLGSACCCKAAEAPRQEPSCCSKRAQHDAPAEQPAPRRCDCQLSAPPLVPPGGTTQLPAFFGELARALEFPGAAGFTTELARTPPRAHAPPGFASCFHARLDAGLSRALAFERTLRC